MDPSPKHQHAPVSAPESSLAKQSRKAARKKKAARMELDAQFFKQEKLMLDQVVTGLATLQDAIQTLSTAYIKHTNAVLGEHGAGFDVAAAMAKMGENPLLNLGGALQRAVSPARSAAEAPVEGKKERKKRQHDPDAPKRPLTPFFLYMQTARPIIAQDLGPEAAKGAVSNEGTLRWSNMDKESKQVSISTPFYCILLTRIAMDQCLQGEPPFVQCSHALLQTWIQGGQEHDRC